MVGALTYEEMDAAMKRKTDQVSHTAVAAAEQDETGSAGFNLLKSVKRAEISLAGR